MLHSFIISALCFIICNHICCCESTQPLSQREESRSLFAVFPCLFDGSLLSTAAPLIRCICRGAAGEIQGCMVNNRSVLTPFTSPNHFSSILLSLSDLDINLSPSGNILKRADEALAPSLKIDASGDPKVTWTRVRAIAVKRRRSG